MFIDSMELVLAVIVILATAFLLVPLVAIWWRFRSSEVLPHQSVREAE